MARLINTLIFKEFTKMQTIRKHGTTKTDHWVSLLYTMHFVTFMTQYAILIFVNKIYDINLYKLHELNTLIE